MKVLIIGAGIGGLAAAIALRRAGWDVAIFERRETVHDVRLGGGMHMWTNAMRALDRLGLVGATFDRGAVLERTEFRTEGGTLLGTWPAAPLKARTGLPEVGITRAQLHSGVLAQAVDASIIHFGWRCTGFDDERDSVRASFENGREVRGDLLVGADGIHSIIRAQLLGVEPPRYAGYTQWQSVVPLEETAAEPGLERVVFGRGQRAVHHHVGAGELFWACITYGPPVGPDQGANRKRMLLNCFRTWPQPLPAAIDATEEGAITWAPVHDRPPVRRWGTGRVTLLGDAAHPLTTNLGQGGCLSLEDGVVLADSLGEHAHDVVAGLRAYEARRIRRTSPIVERSRRIAWAGAFRSTTACGIRNAVFRAALNSIAVRGHYRDMLARW